jgi:hypothetical protein
VAAEEAGATRDENALHESSTARRLSTASRSIRTLDSRA